MAIKESRQFKVGPVGVARSSKGGAIIAESVARSANQMSSIFFERAAEDAREAGIKSVAELSDAEVLTLSEDGQPESIKAPRGFGRIATKAREQALLNRFETEISLELTDKAKELSTKFRNSPEAFKSAFENHVAEMSKANGSTVFTQAIENTGAQLGSNVYHRLQAAEADRFDADMAASNSLANSEAYLTYETLISDGQFEAAEKVLNDLKTRNEIDLKAGYITKKDLLLQSRKKKAAYARGLVTNVLKTYGSGMSPEQMTQFKIAIDNVDASYLPSIDDPRLKNAFTLFSGILEEAETDIILANSIKEFASPVIQASKDRNDFETASAILRNQIAASNFDAIQSEQIGYSNSLVDISEEAERLAETIKNNQQIRNRLLLQGDNDLAQSTGLKATKSAQAFGNALIGNIVTQANNLNDMAALQTYLASPTVSNLEALTAKNETMGSLAAELLSFDNDTGGIFKFTETLSTTANSFNDEVRLQESQRKQKNFYGLLNEVRATGSMDKSNLERLNQLVSTSELQEEDRQRLLDKLTFDNGRFKLSQVFNNVKDPSKLSSLSYYAYEGKEREGAYTLSLREKRLIDEARQQMGQEALTSDTNKKGIVIGNAIETEQENAAKVRNQIENINGTLQDTKENREETNAYYDSQVKGLGYESFADYITNSQNPSNPEGNNLLNQRLRTLSVLPEDFFTIGKQLAGGGIRTQGASTLRFINFYENLKLGLNIQTSASYPSNSMFDGFTADEIAFLDKAVSVKLLLDPKLSDEARDIQLVEKLNTLRIFQSSPEFNGLLEDALKLGDNKKMSVSEFVVTEYPEYASDTQLMGMMESAIAIGFAEAKLDNSRFNPKHATKIAETVLDSLMEEDPLITNFGLTPAKTRFGLNLTTAGDRDLFITYLKDELIANVIGGDKIDWDNESFQLVRVGNDTINKGQTYAVVDENKVAYPMEIDDGDGGKIQIATYISTREPEFLKLKEIRNNALNLNSRTEAEGLELQESIIEEYPLGSAKRQEAANTLLTNVNEALLSLKAESDLGNDIYEGLGELTMYFSNPSVVDEGAFSGQLSRLKIDIEDYINTVGGAADLSSMRKLNIRIDKALGFLAAEQRPED